MELGLVQRLIVAARCSEKQNKSMRWDESGWSGRTTQGFFFFILQQDLEVRFYIPVNSRMLTNISLEGHNVHSCSAAPSAGPGWLSHLVIVAQLGQCRCNHPPSFLWAVWEAWDWMCNPFTLPDNLCWAAGLTDSFSWLFHKLTISFPKRTQNVFFFFKLRCPGAQSVTVSTPLMIINQKSHCVRILRLSSSRLSQYRYQGVWSKVAWIMILSPSPSSYEVLIDNI